MSGRMLRWLLSLPHRARGDSRLTIVRHHRVYGPGERPLYRLGVREDVLASQLAFLAGHGLATTTVSEGLDRLAAGRSGHHVALTFDDGYADNVTRALPILAAHGCRATFYLTAGLMEVRRAPWWDVLQHALETTSEARLQIDFDGARVVLPLGSRAERVAALARLAGFLRLPLDAQAERLERIAHALGVGTDAPCELATWEQARLLPAAGMEIGAHTLSHPFLSLHDRATQRGEIEGSIDLIERRLGARPRGLAYPGGDHDGVTVEVVAALGLAHAVTTRAGDNAPGAPRFELCRRALPEAACLSPAGHFSGRMVRAELDGAFDRLRGVEVHGA